MLYAVSLHIGSGVDGESGAGVCRQTAAISCRPAVQGHGSGGFAFPSSVAVDPRNGDVYVADLTNFRVQRFTADGIFVSMFGYDVNETMVARSRATAAQRDVCTAASGDRCGPGRVGGPTGGIDYPTSVATDPVSGDVYVLEDAPANKRVDKYTPEGRFLWAAGKGVDLATSGDLCTASELKRAGVRCGPGAESPLGGGEPGELRLSTQYGDEIAVGGPKDLVYVGDEHRVQEFTSQGQWRSEISLVSAAAAPRSTAISVAVDPAGRLYVVYKTVSPRKGDRIEYANVVRRFDPQGYQVGEFAIPLRHFGARPEIDGIALGPDGRIAAIGVEVGSGFHQRFAFVYDGPEGRLVGELPAPKDDDGLVFDHQGDIYLAATDDQEVVGFVAASAAELFTSAVPCGLSSAGVSESFNCALDNTAIAGSGAGTAKPPSTAALAELAGIGHLRQDEDDDDEGMKSPGPNAVFDADADIDNDQRDHVLRYDDGDDGAIIDYGQPADAGDRTALTSLVQRYYGAAAVADGHTACSLFVPGYDKTVARDFGHGSSGPAYLRAGRSCASVMTLLFEHQHEDLRSPPTIIGVRVNGGSGFVLVGSRLWPAGAMSVDRVRGVWRVQGLLAEPLP